MKTSVLALAVLVLVSLPNRGNAQGNLVFNGGFDTSAAGWTITNVFGSGYEATKGNPAGDVALGIDPPSSTTVPTASQTINSLTPGGIYMVAGDYLAGPFRGGGSPTDFSFGVAIDGLFLFKTAAPTDSTWHRFSFLYTANSSSAALSLSAQLNGVGVSYLIDNISMQAVPEPRTLSLLGISGILSALFAKSRKKRSLCMAKLPS
jgi:hypothetical protein